MNDQQQLGKIQEYIRSQDLAVLATVTGQALPEASVMGFALGENLELYFGTHNTSRKWSNLQKNSKVAVVIGWEQGKTVQYEGEVVELDEGAKAEVLKTYFAHKPTMAKYLSKKESAVFKVVPKWIRYSDSSHDPADVTEISI